MAIDINKLREQYEKNKANSGGGNANYLKLKDGDEITVRILPSKNGDSFFTQSKLHSINEGGQFKYFHCRRTTGEKCPLCDAFFDLWKRSNSEDDAKGLKEKDRGQNDYAKTARSLKPRDAFYMNVAVRPTNEVKVLNASPTLYEGIMKAFFHPDLGDLTDLEKGYDFVISRQKGANGITTYEKSYPRMKPTPAGSGQEVAAMMEGLHDLEALVKQESYDELDKVAKNIMSRFATPVSPTPTTGAQPPVVEGSYLDRLKG